MRGPRLMFEGMIGADPSMRLWLMLDWLLVAAANDKDNKADEAVDELELV